MTQIFILSMVATVLVTAFFICRAESRARVCQCPQCKRYHDATGLYFPDFPSPLGGERARVRGGIAIWDWDGVITIQSCPACQRLNQLSHRKLQESLTNL